MLICVPTPLDERREPDLSYVRNTALAIARSRDKLRAMQLLTKRHVDVPTTVCARTPDAVPVGASALGADRIRIDGLAARRAAMSAGGAGGANT